MKYGLCPKVSADSVCRVLVYPLDSTALKLPSTFPQVSEETRKNRLSRCVLCAGKCAWLLSTGLSGPAWGLAKASEKITPWASQDIQGYPSDGPV